jgi:hypothetical protein
MEYYILTQHANYTHVIQFIRANALESSLHLNRVRFWVPQGRVYTEFQLRFADSCARVDASLDLSTGLPKRVYS